MIDFPKDPEQGQTFVTSEGLMYHFDGVKWSYVESEAEYIPSVKENNGLWLTSDGSDFIWGALRE